MADITQNGCGSGCSKQGGCGTSSVGCGTGKDFSYGLQHPYFIKRTGVVGDPKRIKPLFNIPTLAHIEITYACMEDCIMCYNPTRTKVSQRDKEVVWDIVKSLAHSRIPHTYLIGGEPTYGYSKEELQDYVEYLSDHGSSVTIVTNGQVRLKGMTNRLACYGVSIHGADEESHDSITRLKGSWRRAVDTAKAYVDEGHDVRIIPVIMGRNHDQMYRIAELAWEIGAESVYYDVYEPGGIGEVNTKAKELKMELSYSELKTALGQIVKAHDDFPFRGSVGLGTALPYCFDERLVERNMLANCGVGSYFCAITNVGDFRICNQSKMRFGNVIETPIDKIWMSKSVDVMFRDLEWLQEPCSSCPIVEDCGGGCKVDEGCSSGEFCIDRNVRGLSEELKLRLSPSDINKRKNEKTFPDSWRVFKPSRYLAVTDLYQNVGDIFFKTRYQTVRIGEDEKNLIQSILNVNGAISEENFVATYSDLFDPNELRSFVSTLVQADAIELI